jgi:hypothetical protein
MTDVQAWCDRANSAMAAYPRAKTGALFDEPFDLPYIALMLQDDKFYMAAYVLCGTKDRWCACVDQLPALFMEFMRTEIPEHGLLKLTAVMFRWAARLPGDDRPAARRYLAAKLDFIAADRINIFIRQRQDSDGLWRMPPWK